MTQTMTEFELKFEVPPASLERLKTVVLAGKPKRQRLRAHYFDTAEGDLTKHGISVRVRLEGRQWVQTAKGKTSSPSERLEHNVDLSGQKTTSVPKIDLARHAGTPVGEVIAKALSLGAGLALNEAANETAPELVLLYATDVQRTAMRMEYRDAVVEIALDQGRVFTKAYSADLCELEFELKQGAPTDAVELARQWCNEHGLWLNVITKSMKGQRLGSTFSAGVATKAVAPEFPRNASAATMISAVLRSCLQQILPNASELASGSSTDAVVDQVHQLRVGIRRMRTALRELKGIDSLVDNIDPGWEITLAEVFEQLGHHRDHSQLELVFQPQLESAGGPTIVFASSEKKSPNIGALLRAPAFQDVMLALIAMAHNDETSKSSANHSARSEIRKMLKLRLKKLRSQALKDGKKFLTLNEEHQHRVRKRLKRLRYLSEFSAPFFQSAKVEAFTAALKPAQEALGLYNDEVLALQAYRTRALTDDRALFGAGWLSARRSPNAQTCLETILAFAKAPPFWDKT